MEDERKVEERRRTWNKRTKERRGWKQKEKGRER